MSLVQFEQVSLAYGAHPLLDEVSFTVNAKERVCIVGRNGAGKSTLLKLMAKHIAADSGHVRYRDNLKMGWLEQELPKADHVSVFDVIASGLGDLGPLLSEYDALLEQSSDEAMQRLSVIQEKIEAQDGWLFQQKIHEIINRLALPAHAQLKDLSGGWRRRVLLGKALVQEPDVLLLDEPTNHLDLPAIEWLERLMLDFQGAVVFITHDRAFLQKLATRILELDRGKIIDWPGSYRSFLELKERKLEEEKRQNELFDKKLSQEETWIRQGIKARRTRNEGRVRALKEMRKQHSERRDQMQKASFSLGDADRSGQVVIDAERASYQVGSRLLVDDLTLRIMRGERLGLLGCNGCGKTTLIKLLLGKLKANSGRVKLGTKLQIAYFDQLRDQLDPERTVMDNVIQGSDFVEINGKQRHIMSYLGDFLFSPERARTPARVLSGGESNRLLLAKLFLQPANLLVLDEPTNDLDVESLELLEELLLDYQGSLLLVSHDREFLDNVVTKLLVFEGQGLISQHIGGYADWYERGGRLVDTSDQQVSDTKKEKDNKSSKNTAANAKSPTPQVNKVKLSYKEARELEALPNKIAELEGALETVQAEVNDASFYQQDHQIVAEKLKAVEELSAALDLAMERWMELEAKES